MSDTPGVVFARRMREERIRAGLSQIAFAQLVSEQLGTTVDGPGIARLEKHERAVKLDLAVAVAEVLGLELAELLSNGGSIQARLERLRRELGRQESRVRDAEREWRQAEHAAAVIEREIAELEESGDG